MVNYLFFFLNKFLFNLSCYIRQEEEYGSDPAVPSRGGELTCLGLGQSASSGRDWISPSILPNDLFEEDRESICELLGDVAGMNIM